MEYFAFVCTKDIDLNGQAYIWFNRQQHHLSDDVIYARQEKYQHDTEMSLIAEVRKTYPEALVFTDTNNPGEYRCVKRK